MTRPIKTKNIYELGKDLSVDQLNGIFSKLTFEERIQQLYHYFPEKEVLYTSSFGTKSAFLLYWVSQIRPSQKVHFINTTYHFDQTLQYKQELEEHFNLNIVEVLPSEKENKLTREEQWWLEHPKMCCSINKVVPLEPIIAKHRVWISGLMAYQTDFRSHLRIFEKQGDILKFHPLIDLDEGEFLYYKGLNKLPAHPLETQGYGSVGCTHCTVKGEGRDGRWVGREKKGMWTSP